MAASYFINHLKHCFALDLDGNKALDFTLCNITILAAHLMLYCVYSTCGNVLTYTYLGQPV